MNKIINLTLSGLSLLAAGIVLLFSQNIGVSTSKIIVPILFALAGVLAFLYAQANKEHKIAKQFHLIQGLGLLIFSVLIAVIPDSLESFLRITTYFILVFGIFEITFIFSVLNAKEKLNKNILFMRLAAGIVNLLGAFILLLALLQDVSTALNIAGLLIALGGLGFVCIKN